MKININKDAQSTLTLKSICIDKFNFNRLGVQRAGAELNVKFLAQDLYNQEKEELTINLISNLKCDEMFDLNIEVVGVFGVSEKDFEQLKPNAVAIMFPFLRSQISLLTTQPDMIPVVLPAININKLLKTE